jgi:hypothetical protein
MTKQESPRRYHGWDAMMRRLLNLATAIALLLSFALFFGFIRSFWVEDEFRIASVGQPFNPPGTKAIVCDWRGITLRCSYGGLRVEWVNNHLSYVPTFGTGLSHLGLQGPTYPHVTDGYTSSGWEVFGIGSSELLNSSSLHWPARTVEGRAVVVPTVLPALVFAIPAFLLLSNRRKAKLRIACGLCAHCGYDIRATPNRCPECGHATDAIGGR